MATQRPIMDLLREHFGSAVIEGAQQVYEIWMKRQGAAAPLLGPWLVIGVRPDDPHAVVEAVYRAKAKCFHPDNLETGDEARFKELQAAMEQIRQVWSEE